MFATPLGLVFKEISIYLKTFELFVDIVFTLEILATFYRLDEGQTLSQLNDIRWDYVKPSTGTFFIDCLAALPGLVTLESVDVHGVKYFKLFRFVHWQRFFL